MRKKDLILLGDYVRKNRKLFDGAAVTVLADFCAASNPAFKRERWLNYVYGAGGPNGGAAKPEKPAKPEYQPRTGQRCSCRPGIERDNCPACEGTGMKIDFAAIRARKS